MGRERPFYLLLLCSIVFFDGCIRFANESSSAYLHMLYILVWLDRPTGCLEMFTGVAVRNKK